MSEMLQMISEITEFNDIHEHMDDEHVDKALHLILKIIAKPDIAPQKLPPLINELQALATKFGLLATYYATIYKSKDTVGKKNMYYTLRDSITKLVDALKVATRI